MKPRTITDGFVTHSVCRTIGRPGSFEGPEYVTRCGLDTRDQQNFKLYFPPTDGRAIDCPVCKDPPLSSVALVEVTPLGEMFDGEPVTTPLHEFALDNPTSGTLIEQLYELKPGESITVGGGAAQEYRVRRIK